MPILAQNQTPAHNIDCEVSILGGILQDTTAMGRVVNILSPEHFYVPAHKKIFQAALTLFQKEQPTDFITVSAYLKDQKQLDNIGGLPFILSLIDQTVSAVNIERYCQIVWEKWWVRQFNIISQELIALSFESYEFEGLRAKISEKLSQHLALKPSNKGENRIIKIHDAIEELFKPQEEGEEIRLRKTGIPLLDEHYPIFGDGILTAFLARPNMGKSQVLTWLYCQHLKLYPNHPILFLSLEMTREMMASRFVASSCQIPITTIMQRQMDEEQWAKYWKYAPTFFESNAFVDDTPGEDVTIAHIRSQIDYVIRETGKAPVVFLDYAQLMGEDGEEVSKMMQISRGLKNTASKYKIPIIFALQLNRNAEGRSDKRPQLSDISWGDKFAQDLDGAFGLYGDWYYNSEHFQNNMEWINLKNRHGKAKFTAHMSYNPSINFFAPLDPSDLMRNY